jgi:hypothetical protein
MWKKDVDLLFSVATATATATAPARATPPY